MQSIHLILLTLALTIPAQALRSSEDPSPKLYSPQTYQQQLDNIQNGFGHEVDELRAQVQQVNTVINDAGKSTGVKITFLQQKLADERNTLYQIEQQLKIPYRLKTCKCVQLTAGQKKTLQQKSNQINTKISNLQQQIDQCKGQHCVDNVYLVEQLKNMRIYMEEVNNIINSDCCRQRFKFVEERPIGIVDMSNYLYKDNLRANNWVFGTVNQTNYMLKNFQLSSKYNVRTCPQDKPYVDIQKNVCQQCEQIGAIYDLGSRRCYYCGKLKFLDTTNLQCGSCPQFQFFNFTKRKCQSCDHDQYLNLQTQQCQTCPKDQFFDKNSGVCKTCEDNSQYDIINRVCKPCNIAQGQFWNRQTRKCFDCPYRLVYNQQTKQCEMCQQKNSYFQKSVGKCIQCATGLVINRVNQNCQPCKDGTFYHSQKKACVTCQKGYRYEPSKQHCVLITQNQPVRPNVNPNGCPPTAPRLNPQTRSCQPCPIGEYYSPHEDDCVNNIAQCPPDRPFFNIQLNQCIPCPAGMVYNHATYHCQGASVRHLLGVQRTQEI